MPTVWLAGLAPWRDASQVRGLSAPHRLVNAQVGQRVSALVARVTRVALHPSPFNAVPARVHQSVQPLPQLHVFTGWLDAVRQPLAFQP